MATVATQTGADKKCFLNELNQDTYRLPKIHNSAAIINHVSQEKYLMDWEDISALDSEEDLTKRY